MLGKIGGTRGGATRLKGEGYYTLLVHVTPTPTTILYSMRISGKNM